jgi:predicted nucleic acid-binding protein
VAEVFVFDTSAWLALDEQELGAEEVEAILASAWLGQAEIHSSFVTLTELEYIRTQEQDAQQAAELLTFARSQPVTWHHSDDAICATAAKLKAGYHVWFADAFIAALAQQLDATLIHKDPDFAAADLTLKHRMLPAKGGG